MGHFARRVVAENSPRVDDPDEQFDSDSDDGSESAESAREDGEDVDVALQQDTDRAHLSSDARRTIAAIIIRLASRAQYSKVSKPALQLVR